MRALHRVASDLSFHLRCWRGRGRWRRGVRRTMTASKAERISLMPHTPANFGGATTAAAEVVEAIVRDGGESYNSDCPSEDGGGGWVAHSSKWGMARVAGCAVTATLALAAVIVLMNTSRWQYANGAISQATHLGGVALEVEPVGHVIWLGSKLPNVKRVFLHRNQELLHEAGWKLKLW